MLSQNPQKTIVGVNNRPGLSNRQIAKLLNAGHTSINDILRTTSVFSEDELKWIAINGFTEEQIDRVAVWFAGSPRVKKATADRCLEFLQSRGHLTRPILPIKRIKNPQAQKYSEAWYRNKLRKAEGGLIEVVTPGGSIDLLTATDVIEVKYCRDWKGALGQILVYGYYYPQHTKRIHLIGKVPDEFREKVKMHCGLYDVVVTWAT